MVPAAYATGWDDSPVETEEETLAEETDEEEEETEETEELREPGKCGEELTWSFGNGTLTISGNGEMDHYTDGDAPWLSYKDSIRNLVFSGNITNVGDGAFTDYDALETIDFGPAMHTIGVQAFKSCDGLTSITLPSSFRRFGKECFMSCANLTEIICQGGMPSFNGNCVWDVYATIYYPTNNAWPIEHVLQLTEAFHNRIQFQAGTPETAQPPAETTQATEPPATEATTAPTEAVTEETREETIPVVAMTEPVQTTVETLEETTAETMEETTEETVPEEKEEERKHLGSMSGIVVCAVLFAGVVSFVLIGALVFRRRRY